MFSQKSATLAILLISMIGCDPAKPVDKASETKAAIDEALAKLPNAIHKEVGVANQSLNASAVGFVIDGIRDGSHRTELSKRVQELKDSDSQSDSFTSHGAYDGRDTYFRVSPISDFNVAADHIDFGRVLSVDPKERLMLIDASKKNTDPPTDGWPGIEALDQYILTKLRATAAQRAYAGLIDKFGRDKVVVVWVPEQAQQEPGVHPSPDKHPLVTKLRLLAPETLASNEGFGPRNTSFVIITVAPAPDFTDVVREVDNKSPLIIDEQERIVIIADLADLRPVGAKTANHKDGKPLR